GVTPLKRGSHTQSPRRKPLPKVNPQLVADCKAINSRFGRPRMLGALAQPLPASPLPGSVYSDNNPLPAYSDRGQTAANPRPDNAALVSALPPEDRPETGPVKSLPAQFRRTIIE